MKYIIMADGDGKRWNNYLGIPKHLIEINGETLLGRTTRLLRENGITDYVITGRDERYKEYGKVIPQSKRDCEIDRFERVDSPVCYLYGDVYYTDEAMKTIVNTPAKDVLFFGPEEEIIAIKVENLLMFYMHKGIVKEMYLNGEIDRCIGWDIYKSLHDCIHAYHSIMTRYVKILDGSTDIDYPEDYEKFKEKLEAGK